ncbi:unnamed protein product, partial [Timema podura]|nr:unnamed protein product [Timema podura]
NWELPSKLSLSGIRVNLLQAHEYDHLKKDRFYNVGVLVDTTCPNTQQLLFQASAKGLFDSLHHWLFLENGRLMTNRVDDNVENTTELINEQDFQRSFGTLGYSFPL